MDNTKADEIIAALKKQHEMYDAIMNELKKISVQVNSIDVKADRTMVLIRPAIDKLTS